MPPGSKSLRHMAMAEQPHIRFVGNAMQSPSVYATEISDRYARVLQLYQATRTVLQAHPAAALGEQAITELRRIDSKIARLWKEIREIERRWWEERGAATSRILGNGQRLNPERGPSPAA